MFMFINPLCLFIPQTVWLGQKRATRIARMTLRGKRMANAGLVCIYFLRLRSRYDPTASAAIAMTVNATDPAKSRNILQV